TGNRPPAPSTPDSAPPHPPAAAPAPTPPIPTTPGLPVRRWIPQRYRCNICGLIHSDGQCTGP
ncbi:MAG: hypothetical protein ABSH20_03095, partial [Tepidisphaeraceae bacterium]